MIFESKRFNAAFWQDWTRRFAGFTLIHISIAAIEEFFEISVALLGLHFNIVWFHEYKNPPQSTSNRPAK